MRVKRRAISVNAHIERIASEDDNVKFRGRRGLKLSENPSLNEMENVLDRLLEIKHNGSSRTKEQAKEIEHAIDELAVTLSDFSYESRDLSGVTFSYIEPMAVEQED